MATKAKGGAAKKGGKTAAKPAKPTEEKVLGSTGPSVEPDVEVKDASEVEVSKKGDKITATGRFEVVEIREGVFRMFNENGIAVSPEVEKDAKIEIGGREVPAVTKLKRDAARNNALRRSREIRTPRGHQEA